MSNRTIGIIVVLCWHFVFAGVIFWFARAATKITENTSDRIVICFCKDQEPKKEEPKK